MKIASVVKRGPFFLLWHGYRFPSDLIGIDQPKGFYRCDGVME
jgi:hypothetical protein